MIYAFGAYVVDTAACEIRRDGNLVAAEPQVFDLLVYLLENRDRVVTRDEIIAHVWDGRIVSEAALSSRVKSARQILGDDGKRQMLIRTYHRRGFRFVGEVAAVPSAGEVSLANVGPSCDAATSDAVDTASGIDLSLPTRPSLAVLPFHCLGDDAAHQVIGDGIALDITTRLARQSWLFVIARGSAFRFRGLDHDPRQVADRLGVRYIVEGNVRHFGTGLRIQVTLTDAVAGREVWAENYDRRLADVLTLQDEIVDIIVGAVEAEIERIEQSRALLYQTSNFDAWTAYHRGIWHMFRFTEDDFDEAERLFLQAHRLDLALSRVQAGLSFVHWQRAFLEATPDREDQIRMAFDFAEESIAAGPHDPQGHWALGRAWLLRRDYERAISSLQVSIDLSPSFALGHYSLGLAHWMAGNVGRSRDAVGTARRLSPYDPMAYAMLAQQAVNCVMFGRLDDAADLSDRAARLPNAHVHVQFIATYCNMLAGRETAARRHLERVRRIRPNYSTGDYFRVLQVESEELRQHVTRAAGALGLRE